MDLDQALRTFIEESRELLAAMEAALLCLEASPGDADAINAVFRAMHTIKGSAGLFGLDPIVGFAHVAESVLDRVRAGRLAIDDPLAALLLAAGDHLGRLVDRLAAGASADPELAAAGDDLLARLGGLLEPAAATAVAPAVLPAERDAAVAQEGGGRVESDAWHISVRFGRDLFRNGFDPLSMLRYLATLGRLVHVETVADGLPATEAMDPESCYLGFEIRLAGAADKASLERAFEFVRDDCSLAILAPHSHIDEYLRLIEALPEDNARLGEILLACGALTPRELEEALLMQELAAVAAGLADAPGAPAEAPPPLGAILTDRQVVRPEVVDAALDKQQQAREHKSRESRAIRVDAAKLDALIDLVGELVIAGAGAHTLAARSRDGALVEATSLIGRLVEAIRDGALSLRMVQIGETFGRFNRVVRDVGKELGKDIGLTITGADTELDKAVVEKLADPLLHLVRNAMDHGIEPAAARQAAGKPARGSLRLNACHDSGGIVIEVADDGGGLNTARILEKARARGIVGPEAALTEHAIHQLIFEPGFSTAEQVSNLSGRGVGMDVVRQNIEQLRGTVELVSAPGRGTTVRIRLPLTLAIIDGFLVAVDGSHYVIPLDQVLECVELPEAERAHAQRCGYLHLRGAPLPYLRLREHFEHPGRAPRRENVVVVTWAGRSAGIVVDELKGEFQTVIKPLGRVFAHLRGIGGSTILGDGSVALILDVPALIQGAAGRETRQPPFTLTSLHGGEGNHSPPTPGELARPARPLSPAAAS